MTRQGLMNYAVLVRLLTMSIIWMVLLVWSLNAYRLNCWFAVLIFLVLFGTMLIAGSERALFHRRAMFEECLTREGQLFNLLYSRVLLTGKAALAAMGLALVLMAGAPLFEPRQWSLLFADLLLLTLLIPRLVNAIGAEVRPQYRYAVARQGALVVSLALLWSEAALVLAVTPPHDFSGLRWQEVMSFEVAHPEVHCALMRGFAEVYAGGQVLAIWSVQNALRAVHDPTQSVMLWVGFAALVGFPYLIALAYSRALIGVLGRPWVFWGALAGDFDGRASEPGQPAVPEAGEHGGGPAGGVAMVPHSRPTADGEGGQGPTGDVAPTPNLPADINMAATSTTPGHPGDRG